MNMMYRNVYTVLKIAEGMQKILERICDIETVSENEQREFERI